MKVPQDNLMAIELSYILESNIKKYKDEKSLQETGIVLSMSEDIARCYGLIKISTNKIRSTSLINSFYSFYLGLFLIFLINILFISIDSTQCAPITRLYI